MSEDEKSRLDKIRALLAKAENTPFPDEAKAFFEGAQRLMTLYAIDEAMLRDAKPTTKPVVVPVKLTAPYIRSKGILLAVVARANGCRVVAPMRVREKGGEVSYTLFGYESSVQVVEALFTSLLVQMTSEMLACEKDIPASVHGKTWKNNFLLGFATEIQSRLKKAKDEVVAKTGMGLVLVQDEKKVDTFVDDYYGHKLASSTVTASYNAQARQAGRAAGSRANMGNSVGTSRTAIG